MKTKPCIRINGELREQTELQPPLKLEEVAPFLGCTHWTVRQLIKRGQLHCIRFGRKILVEQSEVRRFLRAARRKGV